MIPMIAFLLSLILNPPDGFFGDAGSPAGAADLIGRAATCHYLSRFSHWNQESCHRVWATLFRRAGLLCLVQGIFWFLSEVPQDLDQGDSGVL